MAPLKFLSREDLEAEILRLRAIVSTSGAEAERAVMRHAEREDRHRLPSPTAGCRRPRPTGTRWPPARRAGARSSTARSTSPWWSSIRREPSPTGIPAPRTRWAGAPTRCAGRAPNASSRPRPGERAPRHRDAAGPGGGAGARRALAPAQGRRAVLGVGRDDAAAPRRRASGFVKILRDRTVEHLAGVALERPRSATGSPPRPPTTPSGTGTSPPTRCCGTRAWPGPTAISLETVAPTGAWWIGRSIRTTAPASILRFMPSSRAPAAPGPTSTASAAPTAPMPRSSTGAT